MNVRELIGWLKEQDPGSKVWLWDDEYVEYYELDFSKGQIRVSKERPKWDGEV